MQVPKQWQRHAGLLHEVMPGLPRAGPSQPQQPHCRAQPGPTAKMVVPCLGGSLGMGGQTPHGRGR